MEFALIVIRSGVKKHPGAVSLKTKNYGNSINCFSYCLTVWGFGNLRRFSVYCLHNGRKTEQGKKRFAPGN
ncbi:MAG: hypothetical protein M0P69_12695 [Bacteroidales bacterium]|jgi:hypothetical protein|nr:hypothetical protein [Bacteroidales bacterium]